MKKLFTIKLDCDERNGVEKKSKDWCINKISRNIPAKGAKQDRRIFMTSSPIPSLSKIFSSNVVVIINIQSMSKTGVNMSSKKRGLKGCK